MSNTDEKAGASPRTDALVESLAYAGSDAAQAVKGARGKHWEQWEAGANARFDAFVKMAYHARTLEIELADAKADALQQFRNCVAEYELRKAAEQLVAAKTEELRQHLEFMSEQVSDKLDAKVMTPWMRLSSGLRSYIQSLERDAENGERAIKAALELKTRAQCAERQRDEQIADKRRICDEYETALSRAREETREACAVRCDKEAAGYKQSRILCENSLNLAGASADLHGEIACELCASSIRGLALPGHEKEPQ